MKKREGKFTSFYLPDGDRGRLKLLSDFWGVNASEAMRRCITICHMHFLLPMMEQKLGCDEKKDVAGKSE